MRCLCPLVETGPEWGPLEGPTGFESRRRHSKRTAAMLSLEAVDGSDGITRWAVPREEGSNLEGHQISPETNEKSLFKLTAFTIFVKLLLCPV
jgi:hypothetical protein